MTTSALGIWTPGDTDDWDLTIDLAATANSIDTIILNQANTLNRRNVPSVSGTAERTTFFPAPAQGNRVYRNDLGYTEAYFALYNAASNPGGATPAGWYPQSGTSVMFSGVAVGPVANATEVVVGTSAIPFTEDTDAPNWHAVNATRVIPTIAGYYRAVVAQNWAGNLAGGRIAQVRKNGASILAGAFREVPSTQTGGAPSSTIVYVSMNGTTDYFDFTAFQDSGATALNVNLRATVEWLQPNR